MSDPSSTSADVATVTESQDVARLKTILEEEKQTHRQPAIGINYVIAAWCFMLPFTLWKLWEAFTAQAWFEALGWMALFGLSTQLYRIAQSPRQTRVTRRLARTDSVEAVGLLAEALEWPDTTTRKSAIEALTRILPEMDVSDSGQLNTSQRACLYRMLHPQNVHRHGIFLIAILKALESVGDEASLPYVQWMVQIQPTSTAQKQLKEAAIRCLPRLQERIEKMRSSQTLLRASAPTPAGAMELLRAAGESATTNPHQLLRASDQPESREG